MGKILAALKSPCAKRMLFDTKTLPYYRQGSHKHINLNILRMKHFFIK